MLYSQRKVDVDLRGGNALKPGQMNLTRLLMPLLSLILLCLGFQFFSSGLISSLRSEPQPHGKLSAELETTASSPLIEVHISSKDSRPVNPRIYGIICEEMFVKDLVDDPEYIAALKDLRFKTFLYPGGSITYYHHPQGTGGFNIRREEVLQSKHGAQNRFLKEASGPDHLEQYIRFVKSVGGASIFVANVLNGTVQELDQFLKRLNEERIPIVCVVLGVEMHLGQARSLGLEGYIEKIGPYLEMLGKSYPGVPIVAHSTPVGRVGNRKNPTFSEWNRRLAMLPGIDGYSQYGWTEFGGQQRLEGRKGASTAQGPEEIWPHYEKFVFDFPKDQIPAYQEDWGTERRMYLLQWGTHADANTAIQGLHIANFYFFMAKYNAVNSDYFAAATSALVLAKNVAEAGGSDRDVLYEKNISLMASYLFTKPFRHFFDGETNLLAASIRDSQTGNQQTSVQALAGSGPESSKMVYLLNSGPEVALARILIDGQQIPEDTTVEIETVFQNPTQADNASSKLGGGPPVASLVVTRPLRGLMLKPFSLTFLRWKR